LLTQTIFNVDPPVTQASFPVGLTIFVAEEKLQQAIRRTTTAWPDDILMRQ
jgi:hypothetical protein